MERAFDWCLASGHSYVVIFSVVLCHDDADSLSIELRTSCAAHHLKNVKVVHFSLERDSASFRVAPSNRREIVLSSCLPIALGKVWFLE